MCTDPGVAIYIRLKIFKYVFLILPLYPFLVLGYLIVSSYDIIFIWMRWLENYPRKRALRSREPLRQKMYFQTRTPSEDSDQPAHSRSLIRKTSLGLFCIAKDAISLRKHAYSNILKISPPKTESFRIKIQIFCIFLLKKHRLWVLVSTQNVCFWAEIRKNSVYLCKPQFYYIKVGFKGVKII